MRKIVCVLVLSCVIMGAAFAEASGGKKNAVAFDVFQLLNGFIQSESGFTDIASSFAYERLIVPHFSIGGDFDFYYFDFDGANGFYFSMAAEGRYYPMSENFDKLFLGTTFGFNVLSLDGKTNTDDGGFIGLITSLKLGYKLIIKNFYIEPSLGYVLSKSSQGFAILNSLSAMFGSSEPDIASINIPTPGGWCPGLRLGFMF